MWSRLELSLEVSYQVEPPEDCLTGVGAVGDGSKIEQFCRSKSEHSTIGG